MDNAQLYRQARDQQERLQTTLASIGDAVIATDARGHVSFMNAVAQSLTGWREPEAIGEPLENVFCIINEFTREPAESPGAKVLQESGIVGLANHTLLLARDGREIPIDDSGAPIRNIEGELIGIILVFRDITERKLSEKRINLLFELSTAFSRALTPKQIADIMVEQARKALGATVGTVSLLVEQGTMFEMLNLHGLSQETIDQYRQMPLEMPGPLRDAVLSDRILWIETFEDYSARYPHFKEAILRNGSRSTICMPLKVDEKAIGGFTLSFPFDKPHTPDEEAFFTTLANLCAQSLERARLYEEETQARTLAESLQNTGAALSSSLELSDVFDQILNNLDRIVSHDLADIMLTDGITARIVRSRGYTQHGRAKDDRETQKIIINVAETYYFDWVAKHKRPYVVCDAQTDPNWIKLEDPDLIRSNINAPILIDGEIAGFLNVNSLTPYFYNASDADFLQTFANQAAIAIKNAQLHQQAIEIAAIEERQRIARDLHDSVNQTLFAANMIAEVLPRLWKSQSEEALPQTHTLHRLTRGAAAEMRVLLFELRPEQLMNTSLEVLLTHLGHTLPGRTDIDLSLVVRGMNGQKLPPDVQIAFYRIAQESLNNIVKHAKATQARIRLLRTETGAIFIITDNGRGFDIGTMSLGIGLKSIHERADGIQAVLKMKSKPGRGTQIRLVWNDLVHQ
jgi:PAS domain S-box-containing protein